MNISAHTCRKSCVLYFNSLPACNCSVAGEAHPIIWPVSANCWPYTAENPLYLRRSMSISNESPSLPNIGRRWVINAWCLIGYKPRYIPNCSANLLALGPNEFTKCSQWYSTYSLSCVNTSAIKPLAVFCTSINRVSSSNTPPCSMAILRI